MEIVTDMNTVCDGQAQELLTVCEGPEHHDGNDMLIVPVSRALHGAHYFIYTQKNAYYIQIFTLCNCIIYISTITCRQHVTHKVVSDGPERNTVTGLNDCV